MEGTALSILIIAAIALAVFLGYKTKINTGFFCIVFAYIIGCFLMGLKPKALIAYWPTNTMFVILAVSLFYNVAAANGTLENISRSLLYACRKFPGLLPYALFFVAVILSVMGAAYFTVLAFLAPITLLICEEARMDKLTGAVAINCGALTGGNFPTAALGVVFRGLMDTAYEATPELTAIDSFSSTLTMFALAIVSSLILITVFRFGFKSNRNIGKGVQFAKPEAYDTKQKQTLALILAMMAVVLIFPVLKLLIPGSAFISTVASKIDVGLVAIVFAVIALLMKLAPQKEIIAKVPWNTILMIAGAGMLIAVAVAAGTIDMLSAWIGSNVPVFLIPIAFSLVGAVMSFFSSTTGVVCPALFPLIPALAASTGISPIALFTCTVLGAQSSAISPFSSGGSLILGSCSQEEERNTLFNRLLFVAVPISVGICAVYNLVVSFIL
ncbi:MAG: SLC13 family permease [Candidatus Faecousia sp.]|nr:SLC13 family permease [Clostridiales bacterium]MDY6179727.1 SLC13 family permease [Candidatus Faecousia sp.]